MKKPTRLEIAHNESANHRSTRLPEHLSEITLSTILVLTLVNACIDKGTQDTRTGEQIACELGCPNKILELLAQNNFPLSDLKDVISYPLVTPCHDDREPEHITYRTEVDVNALLFRVGVNDTLSFIRLIESPAIKHWAQKYAQKNNRIPSFGDYLKSMGEPQNPYNTPNPNKFTDTKYL